VSWLQPLVGVLLISATLAAALTIALDRGFSADAHPASITAVPRPESDWIDVTIVEAPPFRLSAHAGR
jgi:hypothetical protein